MMTVDCEQSQRQSEDIYIVDSGSSLKDVYADEDIHECDVHVSNSSHAELGTLYTETLPCRKQCRKWDLLASLYIRCLGSRLTPAPCAASALRDLHVCTASSSVTCVTNLKKAHRFIYRF